MDPLTPDQICDLLDEVARLRKDNQVMRSEAVQWSITRQQMQATIDGLTAKLTEKTAP